MSDPYIRPLFQRWLSVAKSSGNFRSAQSISEGNFQSCYANNKAEKIKFRRVSQAIDNCAQAHLLKFRKEKRKLQNLLDILDREKKSNNSDETECDSEPPSNDVLFHCPNCLTTYADSSENNIAVSYSLVVNVDDESTTETKGKRNRKHRKSKKKKHLRRSREFKEVTPFYMQHSYSHYHYDPRYDDPQSPLQSKSDKIFTNSEKPSWTKESNPLVLWEARRKKSSENENESLKRLSSSFLTLPPSTVDISDNIQRLTFESSGLLTSKDAQSVTKFPEFPLNPSTEAMLSKSSDSEADLPRILQTRMEKLCKTCIQNFGLDDANTGELKLPDVLPEPESLYSCSFLTPSERQQLSKYNNKGRKSLIPHLVDNEKAPQISKETKLQSHSYNNPAKVELLKKIVRSRLNKGEGIDDLAKENIFSDVLESCEDDRIFPAYERGTDLTFDDYRALRKCKYLRLSEMNIKSLKEATINFLGNT